MLTFWQKYAIVYMYSLKAKTKLEDFFMKKTKKLLMFVSVILCLSMLFAACDGKSDKNKGGAESTTTVAVQSNNSHSRENTAADIKMLVEYFNSTEAAALNSDIFENIDKTIYSYISRAKVGLSNIEINRSYVLYVYA
jgi:hypothetical protein